jgi:ATP dependent DNA ligase domain
MYARLVQKLPQGNVWLYEVKLDGYAALAGRDATRVTLWSRRGNLFTAQFPQIARACERLSPSSLLDGEIVALDESGGIYCNITVQSAGVALLRIRRAIGSWPKPAEHAAFQRPETLGEIFKGIKGAPQSPSPSLNASADELVRVAREFAFGASSPNARIRSTNQGSEPAHGSSTRSIVGWSL